MVSYKLDKYDKYFVAFILVILVIFNIGSCFASEIENVSSETVQNLQMGTESNFFYATENHVIRYAQLEKGYIYHFKNNSAQYPCYISFSNDVPAVNVPYYELTKIPASGTYDFISNNYSYAYFNDMDWPMNLTREKIANMDGAVGDLVSNVGFNQLWSVFEGGIDFIGVVVLVAFGLFLIVLLIKKLSKGKSDF